MVFDTIIYRNIRLSEAPSFGETIIMHDADSKGAINYLNLARELLHKSRPAGEEQSEMSNER
jgi:chromosome partitioning protein